MCAFVFCWWTCAESLEEKSPPGATFKEATDYSPATTEMARRGKKEGIEEAATRAPEAAVLASGVAESEVMAGAVGNGVTLPEGILGFAPAIRAKSAA